MKGATVTVSVPDGTTRGWRTLWRTRPRTRVLFVGRITTGEISRGLNRPTTLNVKAEDFSADLLRRPA